MRDSVAIPDVTMPAALEAECKEPAFWDGRSDRDLARWRVEAYGAYLCERANRTRARDDLAAQLAARRVAP